jgi:hypothetical protein
MKFSSFASPQSYPDTSSITFYFGGNASCYPIAPSKLRDALQTAVSNYSSSCLTIANFIAPGTHILHIIIIGKKKAFLMFENAGHLLNSNTRSRNYTDLYPFELPPQIAVHLVRALKINIINLMSPLDSFFRQTFVCLMWQERGSMPLGDSDALSISSIIQLRCHETGALNLLDLSQWTSAR